MNAQHQHTDEDLDRIRNRATLDAERGVDFGEVLAKARAKARGQAYVPGQDSEEQRTRDQQARDQSLGALIDRFMDRARGFSRDAPPAPPRPPAPSAAEVRLGWYIPERHKGDTLENFRVFTPSQKAALEATIAWIHSVQEGHGGALALIGDVGCGKSHLLHAAIRRLNQAGTHAAAGAWCDLAELWKQAKFGSVEDVTEARQRRDRILAAKALGIDEIRPTSGTEYDTTELSQLMTRAYRNCQGILITSNYADEKLAKIVGLAATSRLTQIVVSGPDMRQPENRRHLKAS